MSLFLFHFLAFFFFSSSPLLRPLVLLLFFFQLSTFAFSVYLFTTVLFFHGVEMCFSQYAWQRKMKKTYTARFLVWIPIFTCFFSPLSVLLYLFCAATCQDGKSSLSLVWQYPCSVYIRSALNRMQKCYLSMSTTDTVNQKTVQFLMFVSIKLWFNLNM